MTIGALYYDKGALQKLSNQITNQTLLAQNTPNRSQKQ